MEDGRVEVLAGGQVEVIDGRLVEVPRPVDLLLVHAGVAVTTLNTGESSGDGIVTTPPLMGDVHPRPEPTASSIPSSRRTSVTPAPCCAS